MNFLFIFLGPAILCTMAIIAFSIGYVRRLIYANRTKKKVIRNHNG